MDSLRASYVLANTPDFLFRRFRRDANVLALAHKSAAELRELAATKLVAGAVPDDIVEGYAAIVALSHKSLAQVQPEFAALDAIDQYWAPQLVAKLRAVYRTSESRSHVELRPLAPKAIVVQGSSIVTTSSNDFDPCTGAKCGEAHIVDIIEQREYPMKTSFAIVCLRSIRDADNNRLSAIDLLETFVVSSFPVVFPRISIIWCLQRTIEEPAQPHGTVTLTLNGQQLQQFTADFNFSGQLSTRAILAIGG